MRYRALVFSFFTIRFSSPMLLVRDIRFEQASQLLACYGLSLHRMDDNAEIPGTYWGAPEAGIIGPNVYVRDDTPVHSLLHEAGHLIVLSPEKREHVHTDATDSDAEENALLLLQVLLAERLDGATRDSAFADMDTWGYSFRLGSARAYFEQDADDSWDWLRTRGLVDDQRRLVLPS